jgi:hypothetical protein
MTWRNSCKSLFSSSETKITSERIAQEPKDERSILTKRALVLGGMQKQNVVPQLWVRPIQNIDLKECWYESKRMSLARPRIIYFLFLFPPCVNFK